MSDKKVQDDFFDLFAFLVTSARGSLEEGVFAASLRLINAAEKLPDILPPGSSDDKFLKEMQSLIKEGMTKDYLGSEERYIAFLDSIVQRLALEVRKRNDF
jgi:hypothetical protein